MGSHSFFWGEKEISLRKFYALLPEKKIEWFLLLKGAEKCLHLHSMSSRKNIAILGSTGSIGTQALEVIREQASHFNVEVLTSNSNAALLIKQAEEFATTQ